MQEYPLFPRVIRLVLYAGAAVASLAAVPAIVNQVRPMLSSTMQDAVETQDASPSPVSSDHHSGTISILPVGPETELHRQAELAALRDKLASTRPVH